MKPHLSFYLICVLLTLCHKETLAKEYFFQHYDITNGLSQNTVHKIIQDKAGFLWFGTKDGLNRFDGKDFKRIDVTTESENCSYISALFEDSTGKIWVGSNNGPYIYSPELENLVPFHEIEKLTGDSHYAINDFAELPDGKIIIAVENDGLYSFNPEDESIVAIENIRWHKTSSVMSLCYSPQGTLFIGTFGDGVYYTDNSFRSIKKLTDIDGISYFDNCVINVIRTNNNRVYIGTDAQGLFMLNEETGRISKVFDIDENGKIPFIRDVNFNNDSEILIATESGLYIYDKIDKMIKNHLIHDYFDKYSLSDDAIYSLYFDREGGLWIGSYFGGIDYHGNSKPEFIKYVKKAGKNSLNSERIRELCRDSVGNIYIGSEDAGLSKFDPSTGDFTTIPGVNEKNIHGICLAGKYLLIGTFSQGLLIFDTTNGKINRINTSSGNGLVNNYVFSICHTSDDDIYIGTFAGLQRYDLITDSFKSIDDFNGLFIYNIKEDSQRNLWVATYSNGLFLLKAGTSEWINFTKNNRDPLSLPSNKIYSIQEDNHNNIWVMTQNGACVYNGLDGFDKNFLNIDKIPGVVYRVEEDDNGKYWLTSNHGLYCIDPYAKTTWNFTVDDGLPTNQFNYNSSLKTPDGKIYFGSINGLISFDPKSFNPETISEITPIVSELYINSNLVTPGQQDSPLQKSIIMTDQLTLQPWQNSIALNVVNLTYNSSAAGIKYRLEGYDDEWKITGNHEDLIKYSNLPSGDYKFKALSIGSDGNEIGQPYELGITVKQPIYKTWWAITLYILAALSILGILYFYRRKYSRLSNERLMENYKHEKELELYDSKIKFFTNLAHEIRTPLTLIKVPLDSVSKNSDLTSNPEIRENLDVVNLNVERLLQLVNQLLDFRKLESGNYIINKKEVDIKKIIASVLSTFKPTIETLNKRIEVSLPNDKAMVSIDEEAVTKIISNLIANALKYGQSYIRISLTDKSEGIELKIANDGKLIDRENREKIFSLFTRLDSDEIGYGIGLTFARNLAVMHGGSLEIEDSINENIFVLKIPHTQVESVVDGSDDASDLEKIVKSSGENENILLVEDNQELLVFIQKRLLTAGYKVFTAMSGLDAITILEEQHIDIIVTDIMMPEMDGNEFLHHIKEDFRYSHIPVIVLTAKTNLQDKLEGLEAGADYYIEKPFSFEYLLVSINSLLKNRDRIRQKIETNPLEKIPTKGLTKTDEEFLKKLNNIITKNFSNPDFSVDDIITEMNMGSTSFYRKVKGLLNLNPNQYIKIQRLKEAARLFQQGNTSVSEVCYLVGFSSPGYFARCFQKQFGVQPKDYIKGKS